MNSGYLYVANKNKFVEEAKISAQSIRRFSKLPIALVLSENCNDETVKDFFDIVVIVNELNEYTYLSKIIGLQNTPFEKTIFLDSDTFVCCNIDCLFELLEFSDIATTQENSFHTLHPDIKIKFRNIIPEFNSGIIVIKKNLLTDKVLKDWFSFCVLNNLKNDMPGLREAILENFNAIKYFILPQEFNAHGFGSM